MAVTLYGLRNCDSCKKALKWLTENDIQHSFIDFKLTPPTDDLVSQLVDNIPYKKLLNKRSTAWKQLSSQEQLAAESATVATLIKYPNLIKRPVLISNTIIDVGFSTDTYEKTFTEEKQ